MGTNYYHRTNICSGCGRYDEKYIGKDSYGWTFSFEGYRKQDKYDTTPEIKSYKDWLALLEAGGEIYDEYDKRVTLEEFRAMVEREPHPNDLNHTRWCRGEYPPERYVLAREDRNYLMRYLSDDVWLDDEGYSFSDRGFS